MHRALEALRSCRLATDWVRALGDTVGSATVAEYIHANGFRKILLREYDDGSRLRLHLWQDKGDPNIHDHRWAFTSLVLSGGIEERLYAKSDGANEYRVYKHTKSGLQPTSTMRRLDHVQTLRHAASDIYHRDVGVVHSASPYMPRTASLVATEAPRPTSDALVFSPSDQEPQQVSAHIRTTNLQGILEELHLYDSRGKR